MKKLPKILLHIILALQLGLFLPMQARADFFGDVLNAAAEAGGWPSDLPPPTALIALIDVVKSCTDLSAEGMQVCIDKADANPVTHELLGDNAEKIQEGLKIYIYIRDGDYLALMKKLGKTAGCAAAAILTGIPVCELAEALAAVAGAVVDVVGDAGEALEGWLSDLDFAMSGPVPHMDMQSAYKQFYFAYMQDYIDKSQSGKSVDKNTPLKPYLGASYFNNGGSYAEFGLSERSLAQTEQVCVDYFNGSAIRDSQRAAACGSDLTPLFLKTTQGWVAQAKVLQTFGQAGSTMVENTKKTWRAKFQDVDNELAKGHTNYLPMEKSSHTYYFLKVQDRIGTFNPSTYYPDPKDITVQVSSYAGGGTYNGKPSAARATMEKLQANFKLDAVKELGQQLQIAQPDLQKEVDAYRQARMADLNKEKVIERDYAFNILISDALNKLGGSYKSCSTMGSANDLNYAQKCTESYLIGGCYDVARAFTDSGGWVTVPKELATMSDAQYNTYMSDLKAALGSCEDTSSKMSAEWIRLYKLHPTYVKGWTDYCKQNLPNDPAICDSQTAATFYIDDAYRSCVLKRTNEYEQQLTAQPSVQKARAMKGLQGKSLGAYQASGKNLGAPKPGLVMKALASPVAGGFCSDGGAAAVAYIVGQNQQGPIAVQTTTIGGGSSSSGKHDVKATANANPGQAAQHAANSPAGANLGTPSAAMVGTIGGGGSIESQLRARNCIVATGKKDVYECRSDDGMRACLSAKAERKVADCIKK